jgi:hypothetical protein
MPSIFRGFLRLFVANQILISSRHARILHCCSTEKFPAVAREPRRTTTHRRIPNESHVIHVIFGGNNAGLRNCRDGSKRTRSKEPRCGEAIRKACRPMEGVLLASRINAARAFGGGSAPPSKS